MLSLNNLFLFIALVCWVGAILSTLKLKFVAWQRSNGDTKQFLYRNTFFYLFTNTDKDDPELSVLKSRVKWCALGMAVCLALAWAAP